MMRLEDVCLSCWGNFGLFSGANLLAVSFRKGIEEIPFLRTYLDPSSASHSRLDVVSACGKSSVTFRGLRHRKKQTTGLVQRGNSGKSTYQHCLSLTQMLNYGLFTYIWLVLGVNVGKYTQYIEHLGNTSGSMIFPNIYIYILCIYIYFGWFSTMTCKKGKSIIS